MPHSTAHHSRNAHFADEVSMKTPKPPSHSEPAIHGLRAHLQHLLPRHALFHVRVQIHQISSVPLVHGQFGMRWKFRHVKSHAGQIVGKEKGKGKAIFGGKGKEDDTASGESSLVDGLRIPSVVVSASSPITPTAQSTPSLESSASSISSLSTPSTSLSAVSMSTTPTPSQSSTSSASSTSSNPDTDTYSPARGHTPFYKLTDHAVHWEHPLNVLVKMDIDRETSELQPNELKLVFMQRVIPGDLDAPDNPRLGAVYLNLAEYASVREPVTRRYLLRESKTNATLKLTTEVTFVSGDSNYHAPILPKGEILNGVAGLLDSDVYRTRPRALELWGPYYNQEELEMDLLGGASMPDPNNPRRKRDRSRARSKSRTREGDDDSDQDHDHDGVYHDDDSSTDTEGDSDAERYEVPFDVSRLPLAYGPKTTEILIEALFNPVKVVKPHDKLVAEKESESPFELVVDEEEENARKEMKRLQRGADKHATIRPRNGSRKTSYNQSSENGSVYSWEDNSSTGDHSWNKGSGGSHEEEGRGRNGGVKAWFTRKASRPQTPAH